MDWLLYDNGLRHERVKKENTFFIEHLRWLHLSLKIWYIVKETCSLKQQVFLKA